LVNILFKGIISTEYQLFVIRFCLYRYLKLNHYQLKQVFVLSVIS